MAAPRAAKPSGPRWDQIRLAPVILIKAGEDVPAERAVDRLQKMALSADPNTEIVRIDERAYTARDLATLTSPSLFGEAKLLRVDHLENSVTELVEDLKDYVTHPEADCILILVHHGGNAASGVMRAVAKAGHQVCTIPKATKTWEKADLVREEVALAEGSITNQAVEALVDALGSDTRELLAAAAQLVADVQGRIDDSHVRAYYSGRKEATGFQVADAAIAGRTGEAIALARHAAATGTPAVPIVAALAVKLRYMALSMGPNSAPKGDWRMRNAAKQARGWSSDGLAAAISAVAQADAEVKGASRDPDFALERAIIRIGRARSIR